MKVKQWELWYADFPFEDMNVSKDRPVVILDDNTICVLTIKITTHSVRKNDPFDVELKDWQQAGLLYPSVARVSKMALLDIDKFRRKIGKLTNRDIQRIMDAYIKYMSEQ